jgi:hypothetical protein
VGRLIHIFQRYTGTWVEHPDLHSSQILQLQIPQSWILKNELVQEVVYEMKDVSNGISVFNPLGGAQSLLPIPTDLTTNRNADDEIDEIDTSQSVRITQNKSVMRQK